MNNLDVQWFWILVLVTWILVVLFLVWVLGFCFCDLPFQGLGHCAGRLEASQLESRSCFEVAIIIFLFDTPQLFFALRLA